MLGVEPRRYGDYATKSYLKTKNEVPCDKRLEIFREHGARAHRIDPGLRARRMGQARHIASRKQW